MRIVIITHAHDRFADVNYLLHALIRHWTAAGHHVSVVVGLDNWPDADVAILHIDLSVIPTAYADAARRYPVVVNGRALDIRKRTVSRNLLCPTDDWRGRVIVKTDLNYGGRPEQKLRDLAGLSGAEPDIPGTVMTGPYPVLDSIADVSDEVWRNPDLVVERFLPEQDERGYWMRLWVFFGDQERCTRFLSSEPVIKGGNLLAYEPAPVPDSLRAERERLGFDYGKFDFVMHEGQPVLLDANRTPGAPPHADALEAAYARLARGIDVFAAHGTDTGERKMRT